MIKLYSRFRFSDTKVVILQNHQKDMLKKITLILTLLCMLVLTATGSNRRFTLVIDPGHGGHDVGALGAISKEKHSLYQFLSWGLGFGIAIIIKFHQATILQISLQSCHNTFLPGIDVI
jgi:hypothetical protein